MRERIFGWLWLFGKVFFPKSFPYSNSHIFVKAKKVVTILGVTIMSEDSNFPYSRSKFWVHFWWNRVYPKFYSLFTLIILSACRSKVLPPKIECLQIYHAFIAFEIISNSDFLTTRPQGVKLFLTLQVLSCLKLEQVSGFIIFKPVRCLFTVWNGQKNIAQYYSYPSFISEERWQKGSCKSKFFIKFFLGFTVF